MVVTFLGVKNWQMLAALWADVLSCNKKKSRQQNAAGRARLMRLRRRSITPYKILHLLFLPLVRIVCALRLESRKQLLTWS